MTTHQNFEGPGQLTLLQYKNYSKIFMTSWDIFPFTEGKGPNV